MTDIQILLVDDSKVVRMVIAKQLEKIGCAVDIAGDGLEAVAAAEKKRYDMIFMDVMMPLMDGLEATKQIRQIEQAQGFKRTIIVGVTGYVNRAECIGAGMDDFIFKPVTINQLKDTVMQWCPQCELAAESASAHLFGDESNATDSDEITSERIAALKKNLGYD
jgi:CheY-like chemotaxis protein